MKFFREPLVHFLVIGAALFVIYGLWGQQETEEQERAITITAGEINWLTDNWEKRWTRPPTEKEREGMIDQYLREMILYREAVAMGLDRRHGHPPPAGAEAGVSLSGSDHSAATHTRGTPSLF